MSVVKSKADGIQRRKSERRDAGSSGLIGESATAAQALVVIEHMPINGIANGSSRGGASGSSDEPSEDGSCDGACPLSL